MLLKHIYHHDACKKYKNMTLVCVQCMHVHPKDLYFADGTRHFLMNRSPGPLHDHETNDYIVSVTTVVQITDMAWHVCSCVGLPRSHEPACILNLGATELD